jgi:NADPH-dependent glutamate synthase beta subunit-like oxidoreductase
MAFAGGDVVRGPASVVHATADGVRVARAIDRALEARAAGSRRRRTAN